MPARNAERAEWGDAHDDQGCFARPDGKPLRPEYVLRRFRALTAAAGLPRVRVHDLRHLAASMMIAAGVPLPIVSKTLRHSTVSRTSPWTRWPPRSTPAEAEARATRRAAAALAEQPAGDRSGTTASAPDALTRLTSHSQGRSDHEVDDH